MFDATFEMSLFHFTSLVLDFSIVVIFTDQLLQAEFYPAAFAILQLALLASCAYQAPLVTGNAGASLRAGVLKGTRVKTKAFNALPPNKNKVSEQINLKFIMD